MHPTIRSQLDEARDLGDAIARAMERAADAAERGRNAEALRVAQSAVPMVGYRYVLIRTMLGNLKPTRASATYDRTEKLTQRLLQDTKNQAVLLCELVYALQEQ